MGETPYGDPHNSHRASSRLSSWSENQTGENGTGRHPDFQGWSTIMSERQRGTSFLKCIIRHDESDEGHRLEKSIAQIQRGERCVRRFASVMALFPLLAIAGVAYGTMLQNNFPYDGFHPVIRVLCQLGLASLICLAALAGLLMGYRKKLKRLREECRQLASSLLESHLDKPHIGPLPRSHRGSEEHEAFQDAGEVSAYHGSLDSPSWFSNRLCG
jgi:hypothetical protein